MSMRDGAAKANSPESDELRRYKEARVRVEDAVGSCLLSSLQLIPANPAIGYEIWDVLSLLPYEVAVITITIILLLSHIMRNIYAYPHKSWKGYT